MNKIAMLWMVMVGCVAAEEISIINVLPISEASAQVWFGDKMYVQKLRSGVSLRIHTTTSPWGIWRCQIGDIEKKLTLKQKIMMPALLIGKKAGKASVRCLSPLQTSQDDEVCLRLILGGGGTQMGISFQTEPVVWAEEETEIVRWFESPGPEYVTFHWRDQTNQIQKVEVPVETSMDGTRVMVITERARGRCRVKSFSLLGDKEIRACAEENASENPDLGN